MFKFTKNILVTLMVFGSLGVFANEFSFICNEPDVDLKITSSEKVLIINTEEKHIKFNDVEHSFNFQNSDLLVQATFSKDPSQENRSILKFEKISGKLVHYFNGVNFFKCRRANRMMP